MLVGGMKSIMQIMRDNKITPTAATLTTMLTSLPWTTEAENELIKEGEAMGVKFDTDFFNMIIKRRGLRGDLSAAKEMVVVMQSKHLPVDIVTFGVLSIACTSRTSCLQFLKDMSCSGFTPNLEIISTLLNGAIRRNDFYLIVKLMQEMQERNVTPDPKVIEYLENAKNRTENYLLSIEHGKINKRPESVQVMQSHFDSFKLFYKSWLKNVKLQVPQSFQQQFDFELPDNPKYGFYKFEKEMRKKMNERMYGQESLEEYALPDDQVD